MTEVKIFGKGGEEGMERLGERGWKRDWKIRDEQEGQRFGDGG